MGQYGKFIVGMEIRKLFYASMPIHPSYIHSLLQSTVERKPLLREEVWPTIPTTLARHCGRFFSSFPSFYEAVTQYMSMIV